MDSRTIELDRGLTERLARLARESERSLGAVVHEAVDEYLARHEVNDATWRARLAAVVGRLRTGVPHDEGPEIIEFEITAAREEERASRAAGGG